MAVSWTVRRISVLRLAAPMLFLFAPSCGLMFEDESAGANDEARQHHLEDGLQEPRFDTDGFHGRSGPLRIAYLAGSSHQLMAQEWSLDNFASGWPSPVLRPQTGERWWNEYPADLDGDGVLDDRVGFPTYELRFTHANDGAVVWVRGIPVPPRFAQRDLEILAHDYVEAVSGSDYFAFCLGGCLVGVARSYATTIVEEQVNWIFGIPAYDFTFDVANLDQLQLDPRSRSARVRILLVRPGYEPTVRVNGSRLMTLPAFVVIGYANVPERFDDHVVEFEDLLARMEFWPEGVPATIETPPARVDSD